MFAWLDELDLDPAATWRRMGTRSLGHRPWLVVDDRRDDELAQKAALLAMRRDEVLRSSTEYHRPAADVRHLVESEGVRTLSGADDLEATARSVQEDLCLLQRHEQAWHLDAACVCFPSRWRLADKIGRPLVDVHGPTPGYAEELDRKVTSLLDRLGPRPVLRRNWFVHPDPSLFQPVEPVADPIVRAGQVGTELHVRSERQTLRRLPSGWILFTIRVQQAPVGRAVADTAWRDRFVTYLREAPGQDLAHRGMQSAQVEKLLDALGSSATPPAGKTRRQVSSGRSRVPACMASTPSDPRVPMTSTENDAALAADLVERDVARVWHPYAPMPAAAPPVPVVGASGTRLRLADGREAIDGMSSWWAAIHGYRHPVLDQAVRDQLDATAHVMFGGLTHPAAVDLADLLVEISPAGLAHVFLADSGSVSIEVAIKMALQHARGTGRPERTRLLTVRSGYHGDTLACMSVCDPVNGMHSMFTGVLPPQLFAPEPTPRFGEAFDRSHVDGLRALLDEHSHEIAAVILEPVVQGAGGMRFYAPQYLAEVRRLCDEHDVLLIADEIATGFGRTGKLFACEHAGITPDIMCVGKALTGGYLSMAAALCTPAVAAGVSAAESGALMHGPTFMGNPLAASVAAASIRLLQSRPWQDEVSGIEAHLRTGLAAASELPGVADVRVLGAIGVIEAVHPVPMAAAQELLLEQGVWLRPFGRLLYTMPPYVSSDDDLDAITSAMVAVARTLS